jgi:4-diphosphocytidyl-2-C-methyl-D-erythritol kinase
VTPPQRASRLRCRAPGKVNLCLFVGRPRPDGYHPLVSLIQPVSLADELVLEPGDGPADEVECPGVDGENLAARALAAYRASGWRSDPVRLVIEKRVPVAGGMGGGSADAAAALRLAAAADERPADRALLGRLAQRLGSDVDALVDSERCLIAGIGHRVADLPRPVPFGILVLPSGRRLRTPDVYAEYDRLGLGRGADELDRLTGAVGGAAHDETLLAERLLHNDLETAARSLCPPIGDALADVRASGAARAMVSGSGPTVFGLFPGADGPAHAEAAAHELRGRHPAAVAAAPVGREYARAEVL